MRFMSWRRAAILGTSVGFLAVGYSAALLVLAARDPDPMWTPSTFERVHIGGVFVLGFVALMIGGRAIANVRGALRILTICSVTLGGLAALGALVQLMYLI